MLATWYSPLTAICVDCRSEFSAQPVADCSSMTTRSVTSPRHVTSYELPSHRDHGLDHRLWLLPRTTTSAAHRYVESPSAGCPAHGRKAHRSHNISASRPSAAARRLRRP